MHVRFLRHPLASAAALVPTSAPDRPTPHPVSCLQRPLNLPPTTTSLPHTTVPTRALSMLARMLPPRCLTPFTHTPCARQNRATHRATASGSAPTCSLR
eukprot:scaffold6282_cov70-Phaeocystis_antarctica.AAC.1